MKPIEIKGMQLGAGRPKVIISLMHDYAEGSLSTIEKGLAQGVDCFEWRGDFCADVHNPEKMVEEGKKIAAALPNNPLLFTFRSESQGGNLTLPVSEYVSLNKALIQADILDLVDIETWIGDSAVLELVACAKEHGVKTVISYHNFQGTPSKEWMVNLMTHMQDLGADIPKIAVMAKESRDALELLAATEEMTRIHAEGPLLTMAMGGVGSITRLTGELFGSALTFCALEASSAPGQVSVSQAVQIMDSLHEIVS
ncbi:MAG: type I 3-dehydroquinate dehydratase [Anaerotardibacter sp.]